MLTSASDFAVCGDNGTNKKRQHGLTYVGAICDDAFACYNIENVKSQSIFITQIMKTSQPICHVIA